MTETLLVIATHPMIIMATPTATWTLYGVGGKRPQWLCMMRLPGNTASTPKYTVPLAAAVGCPFVQFASRLKLPSELLAIPFTYPSVTCPSRIVSPRMHATRASV